MISSKDALEVTIAKDGVLYQRYYDNSEGLALRRDRDATNLYGGDPNERLNAMRKQDPSALMPRGMGVCQTATELKYQQVPRPYSPDSYRAIHSDLKRSHVPQSWAAEFMPIITPARFSKWLLEKNRTVLEFHIPEDPVQLKAISRSYIMLILRAWDDIETTKMVRSILNGLEISVDGKTVRIILDELLSEDYLTVRHNAHNAHGVWPVSPRIRRYRWNRQRGPSVFDNGEKKYRMRLFAEIAAPFEACAKVQMIY